MISRVWLSCSAVRLVSSSRAAYLVSVSAYAWFFCQTCLICYVSTFVRNFQKFVQIIEVDSFRYITPSASGLSSLATIAGPHLGGCLQCSGYWVCYQPEPEPFASWGCRLGSCRFYLILILEPRISPKNVNFSSSSRQRRVVIALAIFGTMPGIKMLFYGQCQLKQFLTVVF